MPIAGHRTIAQLRKFLDENEKDQRKRDRLFIPFGGPRAELLNKLREEILSFIISEQETLNNAVALDYGCGIQPYRLAFDQSNVNIIAADIGHNKDAEIQISCDNRLPFKDGTFDYVFSFQVLEHVPIPQDYLNESFRLLQSGGKIFLTTHGVWPFHPTPGDYHRWTKQGLIFDLELAGFKVIKTGDVLNENSGLIQSLIINYHYKKKLKGYKRFLHHLSQLAIRRSEKKWKRTSDIPCIISILAKKQHI